MQPLERRFSYKSCSSFEDYELKSYDLPDFDSLRFWRRLSEHLRITASTRDRFLHRVSTWSNTDIEGPLSNGTDGDAGTEETSIRVRRSRIRMTKHIALRSAHIVRQEEGWNSSTMHWLQRTEQSHDQEQVSASTNRRLIRSTTRSNDFLEDRSVIWIPSTTSQIWGCFQDSF